MIDLGATEEVEIDDSLAEIDDPDAEIDEASETRYLAAADLLEVVVRFWRDFFRIYRPDVTVEPSKHHTL